MPPATKYITTSGAELNQLEDALRRERSVRVTFNAVAWRYYEGQHRQPLKSDGTGTDDNVIVNVTETIVDKGVANLLGVDDEGMVVGLTFDIVDEPGEPGFVGGSLAELPRMRRQQPKANPSQDYLDAVWNANNQQILLNDVLLSCSVTGHAFVKLLPDGKEGEDGSPLPRLVNMNPDNVAVFWAEDDMDRVLWYRIEYARARQDIVRDVREDGTDGDQWLIYNYRRATEIASWESDGEPQVWPYAWPPVVDWKNRPNPRGYYGLSDVGLLGRLNDSLNFVMSNTQRILKHHAHPKTIGLGIKAGDVEATAVDGFWTVQAGTESANIYNLEMQSDLASSLQFSQMLLRSMFDIGRELNPGTVADKLGQITNFGLRVLYSDSLSKAGIKRMLAGEALKRICRRLLELGGYDPRVKLNVIWPDPLPRDALQQAQALQIDAAHGLSQETYLERRGYDAAQEEQRSTLTRIQGQQAALAQRDQTRAALLPNGMINGGFGNSRQPPG